MANIFSTGIFCIRNADKVTSGENIGRAPAAVGQANTLIKEIAKYDEGVAKTISSINSSSPLLKGLKIGADFASGNINKLICGASAIKVLTADDKESEFIHQTGAIGAMLCGEKCYKTLADYENIKKFAAKIGQSENLNKLLNSGFLKSIKDKVGDKRLKLLLNIAYGLCFVATSISGYNFGEKVANSIINDRKCKKAQNELNMMKANMQTAAPTMKLAA